MGCSQSKELSSPGFALKLILNRSGLDFSLTPTIVLLLCQRLDFSEPLFSPPLSAVGRLRPASMWLCGVDHTRILVAAHSTTLFLPFLPLVLLGNRYGSGAGMVGTLLRGAGTGG